MKYTKSGNLLFIIVLAVICSLTISVNHLHVHASEGKDTNIEVSDKDNSIQILFSEKCFFFDKCTAEYLIIQDSESIEYEGDFKRSSFLMKQYGLSFKASSSWDARVLMLLRAKDGLMEEALLYDISIDDDNNVTYNKLEHFVPSYPARKGVENNLKQLLIDEYAFSEDDLEKMDWADYFPALTSARSERYAVGLLSKHTSMFTMSINDVILLMLFQ